MPSPLLPAWTAAVLAGLTAAAQLYSIVLAVLFVAQRHILFRPDRTMPLAERVGQPGLEAIRVASTGGLDLLAWYLPAPPGAPVVLYLHGNAGHIGHRGERVRHIAAQGWGALFVEYRGYGGNPGTPSEAGLRDDAAAGLAALRQRGIAPTRIVVWGESLGSGLATALAAREPVGAVVLETPYTAIADIARQRYRFAPVDLLLKDRFESLAYVPAIRAPILVAVAGRDRVVPPAMGKALYAAATALAELWVAEEGGHTDLLQFGLIEAVADFLARHLATPPG